MKVSGGDGTRGTMGINRYEVVILIVVKEWLLVVNEDVHDEELARCKVVHTEDTMYTRRRTKRNSVNALIQ